MNKSDLINNLDVIQKYMDAKVVSIIDKQSKLNDLTSLMGLSGTCVAESKKLLGEAKKTVIEIIIASGDYKEYTPTVIKEIIAGQTVEQQGDFDRAERLNAGITHAIDGLRSIISLYKSEMEKGM